MKKRLALILLVLVMCLSVAFAACDTTNNDKKADLKAAANYVKVLYRDKDVDVTKAFTRKTTVAVDNVSYDVAWSANVGDDKVKISAANNGEVTVSADTTTTVTFEFTLTATVTKEGVEGSETVEFKHKVTAKQSDDGKTYVPERVDLATIDTAKTYKLVQYNPTKQTNYYFTTEVFNTYYWSGESDYTKAVDVTVAKTEKGYTLAVQVDGATKYLACKVSGTHYNLVLQDAAYTFTYNTEKQALVCEDGTNAIGSFGTNQSYGMTKIDSDNSFFAYICTLKETVVAPKTAQEKADEAAAALTVADITSNEDRVLPTTSAIHDDVTITWALEQNTLGITLATDGKTLKIASMPTTDSTIKLTATLSCGTNGTATKVITVNVKAVSAIKAQYEASVITAPKAETAYFLALYFAGNDDVAEGIYYFTGAMEDGKTYSLDTSTDKTKAAKVYLETAGDAYRLYFLVDGVKNYIELTAQGNGAASLKVSKKTATESATWTFNNERNILTGKYDGTNDGFLSGYTSSKSVLYTTIRGREMDNIEKRSYPARLLSAEMTDQDKANAAAAEINGKTIDLSESKLEATLPTVEGATITWAFNAATEKATIADGKVSTTAANIPLYEEENIVLTLVATVKVGEATATANVTVTIYKAGAHIDTEEEKAVKAAAKKINEHANVEIKSTEAVALPTIEGVTIAWAFKETASSELATIADGKITAKSLPDDADKTIVLVATITIEDKATATAELTIVLKKAMTPEEIVNALYELPKNGVLGTYTLTGKIINIDYAYSSSNNNLSCTIVVGELTDKPIYCYKLTGTDADKLAVNDTITVTGKLTYAFGKRQFDEGCTFTGRVVGISKVTVEASNATVTRSVEDETLENGTPFTFTVTPNEGHKISAVKVNGVVVTADTEGKYSAVVNGNTVITVETLKEGETEPQSVVKLTFPDENSSNNKNTAYTETWTAKKGTYEWAITGFNNNSWKWQYIRCGRKNNASVASIATKSAMTEAIRKVVVTIDSVTVANVNSIKLVVATNADFTEGTTEIALDNITTGDVAFNISNSQANCYYKLVFDCKSGSGNGFVQVSAIDYLA